MNTHYALRGGVSSYGASCGTFCVRVAYGDAGTAWGIGTALS